MKRQQIGYMTKIALLMGIITLLAVTPLGYIPIGAIRATTIHIPVIIGAILLGPKAGAILGGYFGLTSLINNTINPTITSFVFTPFFSVGELGGSWLSLIICFVPRILLGLVAWCVFVFIKKLWNKQAIAATIAGVVASMTNTFLVLGGIYLFFGREYAQAKEIAFESLLGVIAAVLSVNGVAEAVFAGIVTALLCKALLHEQK